MDKVIINGVYVSGCEFCMYKGFKAFPQCKLNKDSFATACVQHKDCYYKQLQRLKVENEQLKTKIFRFESKQTSMCEQNKELIAENERLKEENKRIKRDFLKQNQWLQDQKEEIDELKTENERLKAEKSKLLSKCIEKQCRINELQQICAIKEFRLKVNGKEYKKLCGIDKAKLFINNENAVRDKYIQKLENKMSDLQYKFYEKVVDTQKQIDKYKQALQEIREMATLFHSVNENKGLDRFKNNILDKINEVIGAE